MAKRSIQFIPPQKSGQLAQLADRARVSLSRYAGIDVDYNAVGLQTLDEWIDRHVRQFPQPSPALRTIWGAFLGETFRRRYEGQWSIDNSGRRPRLGVVCPKNGGGTSLVFIDVMDQVSRRVKDGMNESLAFYYTIKGVEIKST
ncbi:MAG: hypothetical protein JXC32_05910 [Anaerolineae bacterium]|nr:hypothetical protein [Anaerolineae bacterium]